MVEGDITAFDIDAIISNDDINGRMWATVASSIKSVAGSDIERDSVSRGPYRLCSAWPTHAGNLPAKTVIHVAAMDRKGMNGGLDTIKACIRPAFDLAIDRGMESIALATIGTGFQRIPIREWLKVISPVIVDYLRSEEDQDRAHKRLAVLLVLYEPNDFRGLLQVLKQAVGHV